MSVAEGTAPGAVAWGRVGTVGLSLLAGLVLGFLTVIRGCIDAPSSGVSQERYAVMLSTLYSEGDPSAASREYLQPLGNIDQVAFLTQLAEKYGKSTDRAKQRQADGLRQLADAIRMSGGQVEAQPVPQTAATSSAGSASKPAVVPPRPTTAVPAASGVIRSGSNEGVRLRREPNVTSPTIVLLANGTRVDIQNVVEGQQVEGNEKRWYKVRNGDRIGYVYFPLLVPAD